MIKIPDIVFVGAHLGILVRLILEDPTVAVKFSTVLKELFLYFDLCLSLILDNLPYSYASISVLANCIYR